MVSIITGAASDKESSFFVLVQWLTFYGIRLIVVLIAASIIVLQGLRIYVLVKLRKGRNGIAAMETCNVISHLEFMR